VSELVLELVLELVPALELELERVPALAPVPYRQKQRMVAQSAVSRGQSK
tara:strand:+ start:209 stop:358 length:150 start_codon:yes stop_codon:yes gene_type:complete